MAGEMLLCAGPGLWEFGPNAPSFIDRTPANWSRDLMNQQIGYSPTARCHVVYGGTNLAGAAYGIVDPHIAILR